MGLKIALVNRTPMVIGLSSLAVVLPDKTRWVKLSAILELKSRHKKEWRIPVEIDHRPSEMSLDSCEHALKMSAIVFMLQLRPDGSHIIIAKGVPETTYFGRRILHQASNGWKKGPWIDIDMNNPPELIEDAAIESPNSVRRRDMFLHFLRLLLLSFWALLFFHIRFCVIGGVRE